MKTTRILLITITAGIIFLTTSATATTFNSEAGDDMMRTMERRINNVVQEVFSDQTAFTEMQGKMMATISDAVKKDTAVRKRATVVETCMECRAMQPIKVVVSGRTTVLDGDTQEIINQGMAKKVEKTIREFSSDPAVASNVQERTMKERMANNPLRYKMQPFMMGNIMGGPPEINVARKKNTTIESSLNKTSCPSGDGVFPSC